jgi:hypothetical protein
LLNSANEAAACLVELVNTERNENFSKLAEMQKHMAEQAASQTKNLPMKVVTMQKKMTNRCFDN